MQLVLLLSALSLIISTQAYRDDDSRQNRQLFVTMPPKDTNSPTPATTETSQGEIKRSSLFTRSSLSNPTKSPTLIKYIPLSTLKGTEPDDDNSDSSTHHYSNTGNTFSSSTSGQFSSLGTSRFPTDPSATTRSPSVERLKISNRRRQDMLDTINKAKLARAPPNSPIRSRTSTTTIQRIIAPTESSKMFSKTNSQQATKTTSSFSSTLSMTATQASASTPTSEPSTTPKNNLSVNELDDKRRSALIRGPTRDTQVIFLADDPAAAAKIPGLLTKMRENSRSSILGGIEIFPPSRRGPITEPSIHFSPETRVTIADTKYTLVDLQTTLDDIQGRTSIGVPTEEVLVIQGRRDDSGIEVSGSGRRNGAYPFRNKYDKFDYNRKTYDNSAAGSSIISKEAGAFGGYSSDPFSRSRQGSNAMARTIINMTRVTHIEAECQDNYMRIHTQFNGSFGGLIYSAGYAYDRDCIYVNGSGRNLYDFHIQLNRCGTLEGNEQGEVDIRGRPTQKNMMWNTLTVQYNPLIEEEWDEHFKVTCEYGYDFWKTVTFPFLDVEVQTGNPVVFTLTPPECHMEIRYGYGTSGQRITGPVRVGDPLTLVIYMRSELDGFDIVVSDCFAHNGGNKRISLIDHYGCPVDEKLISHFDGTRSDDGHFETQVFAFMKTFRFTGSPALYIECDVRMCHGDCPPQPCHWERASRARRSVSEATSGGNQGNVSESLNLFQALQVLRDDDPVPLNPGLQELVDGSICLKNGTFSAAAGGISALIGLLTVLCVVLCLRAHRQKRGEKDTTPKPSIVPAYKSDFVLSTKRRLE